jgi:hypothetical protein
VDVLLDENTYHDIVIEYRELTNRASISLKYSSVLLEKQIIPSSVFYYAKPIVGSPFYVDVVPGASDYPYSTAYGSGLAQAVAGKPSFFQVQARDSVGNNKTTDIYVDEGSDLFKVSIEGVTKGSPILAYQGDGLYASEYTLLKAGDYEISIQTGGTDIYCAQGESNACSPFSLHVSPAPAVAYMSEAVSLPSPAMDFL